MAERPEVPKTVKPRKSGSRFYNFIVVAGDKVLVERTGELRSREYLASIIAAEPPSILLAQRAGELVVELDKVFDENPRWQYRLTPLKFQIMKANGELSENTFGDTIVSFFGFQHAKGKQQQNRYHQILDPFLFVKGRSRKGRTVATGGTVPSTIGELLKWGSEVREWCIANDLDFRPTNGGIAAQLLRDTRFYPAPRRKVPRATNDSVRLQLPGNYYRFYGKERIAYEATYFDQVSAHHSCARDIHLPMSDRLYAKGRFRKQEGKFWAKKGTALYEKAIQEHGLFLLGIESRSGIKFPLPCQEKSGKRQAFVWSNEIPYLLETGTLIDGIYAAWTSDSVDEGIKRYAEWSLQETQKNPELKDWLKPTLLATYGILASKPRQFEYAYKRAKSGTTKMYPVSGKLLTAISRTTTGKVESQVANVIHRGMIEAETRLRSIQMAKWLSGFGFEVLAIYADSVFIANPKKDIPFPPAGWKVEAELTNLVFFNEVSFTSDQMTKLPGISKDDADRVSRLRSARAVFGDAQRTRNTRNTRNRAKSA